MKVYAILERENYGDEGHFYGEAYLTPDDAYKMVQSFLHDDYKTYKCFSEEVYNYQIKRLKESYENYFTGCYVGQDAFYCKYYKVVIMDVKEEIQLIF